MTTNGGRQLSNDLVKRKYTKKVKINVSFRNPTPACTDAKTFESWKEIARTSLPAPQVGFCEDCTPEFQTAMRTAGRCENPHVRFAVGADGWVQGTIRRE